MTLYDTDVYAWSQEQATLLAERRLGELDLEHLIEEIADVGASAYRACSRAVYQILVHLLKWGYQAGRRGRSWRNSLVEHRNRLERDLTPSLVRELPAMLQAEYSRACRKASAQTGLPSATFPTTCPWTTDEIMDHDFYPGEAAL